MDRIKESFDSLPIAACFFDKNGVVRLINRRMLAIANCLRKGGIQSLAEMQSVLQAPPANVRCLDMRLRIYRFPDGKALRFAQEQITTKAGVRYTQITAADVTELIRKQNQLKAENAKLEEANEQLRLLFAQIPEIIREEETLAMKLRVHDDIGHSILAARRVLLQHADQKEIRANAADTRAERTGDLRMRGELCPPRRRHRIVCALLAETGLHGGCPDQQRRGAEGENHGGRWPFHAASTHKRSRRQNGGSEHPPL